MEKKMFKAPFQLLLIIAVLLAFFDAVMMGLSRFNFLFILYAMLFIPVTGLFLGLFAMVLNRLITTRWGRFFDGWVFLGITAGILFLPFSESRDILRAIVFTLSYAAGVFLFIMLGKFWEIQRGPWKFSEAAGALLKGITSLLTGLLKITGNGILFLTNIPALFFKNLFSDARRRTAIITISTVIIAAAVLCFILTNLYLVTVKYYTPIGEAPLKSSISIKFSEPVALQKEDVEELLTEGQTDYTNVSSVPNLILVKPGVEYFKISPPLSGSYRLMNNETLTFLPSGPLSPSTRYTVNVITGRIKKTGKIVLGRTFIFNTPQFKTAGVNMFYNYELLNKTEKEAVGEIEFNAPVDINELRKYTAMEIDGKNMNITIEPANVPTRFYVKSGKVERQDRASTIRLIIKKGLNCIGGQVPLSDDFSSTIFLPEKLKLQVVKAETWPVRGNTYIAVLFNMPITESGIRDYVRIEKGGSKDKTLPFSIETEYCYAVLKADFKPNQDYRVVVTPGLPAKSGEQLQKQFDYHVRINDLPSMASFTSKGSILPSAGNLDIELYTVNLDEFEVKIDKIFRNNLVYYLRHNYNPSYSKTLLYKKVDVGEGELNEKIPQFINLKKFHSMEYKGLYNISLYDSKGNGGNYNNDNEGEEDVSSDTSYDSYSGERINNKIVLCTDLGIMAKESGGDLLVRVNSIMNLSPLAGVRVSLVSYENQVITEETTGPDGECVFKNWKINDYKFMPFIVIAEQGEDFSYLEFNRNRLDEGRFSIGGRMYSPDKLNAFLTPEMGVYRPGEKAYLTAVVRNGDLSLPPEIPVLLKVYDPTGQAFLTLKSKVPANGLLSFEVPFSAYAKTGQYEASLSINDDTVIGRSPLKVEEFIPHKIQVQIQSLQDKIPSGQALSFKVKGLQLYGPPAADAKLISQVKLTSRIFSHPDFADYTFSDSERTYNEEIVNLGESQLDDNGEKLYSVDIPRTILPPSALNAVVYTEVYDSGGRPVSDMKVIPVDFYNIYLGLKAEKRDAYFKGVPIQISYVAIDPDGNFQKAQKVPLFIKHRIYYSILKKYSQQYRYESESYEEGVLAQELNIDKKGNLSFTPKEPGYYTIYLGNERDMRSSIEIYVRGTEEESVSLKEPENLSITYNKEKYNIGDTALVTVHSPIPGRLYFSIERDKVIYSKVMDLENKKATISIPVLTDYLPNVYVSAYVVRKPDESLKDLPMSSMGIRNLEVLPGTRKINMALECEKTARSQNGIDVKVRVPEAGKDCGVVLAAVDEGILQVTQFETPDPYEFFYQKISLQTKSYSLFDAVLPDIKAFKAAIGGGDEEAYDISRRHVNPVSAKRVQSIALYSGILKPDAQGNISYHFNIPQFNGRLRVMALAADKNRFGSASKNVTVADPIVVSPYLPRMAAPGDEFEIPVRIYNKTGKTAEIQVSLAVKGPVAVIGKKVMSFQLQNNMEKEFTYFAKAQNDAGKVVFEFTAEGAGESSKSVVEMPVRPAQNLKTVNSAGMIKPLDSATIKVPGGFMPFGQRVRFSISPRYLTKFLGSMEYLVHYPYGCAEQVTSTLFPLLYYKDLARLTGLFPDEANAIDNYINEGIKKLESQQMPDGRFSYWPGENDTSPYLTLYVSHFLLEAERLGYEVSPKVISLIHSSLGLDSAVKKPKLDRRSEFTLEELDIYTLYIKALAGSPDREKMDYLRENELKNMDYADRCRLASTYSLTGDKKTALALLPNEFVLKYFPRALGGDYDSIVKRLSIYLFSLCEINPDDQRKENLIKEIEKQVLDGRFGNTQENALALMAIGKAFEKAEEKEIAAELYVNGKLYKDIKGANAVFQDSGLSGKTLTLVNKGGSSFYYNLLAEGVPLTNTASTVNKGIEVKREYFDKNGKKLNLTSVPKGELVLATITLKTLTKGIDNIVVVDLLPAGFEIENPRLNSRGQLDFTPPYNWKGAYEDLRDDRLILFTGDVDGTFQYSYALRAVTAGEFVIPQIYAEAMYDPDTYSIGREEDKVHVVKTE